MIHIYTGNGKGKTTSVFGLAMRANGQGLKVIVFQFLKPRLLVCGEEISARKLKNIRIVKTEQSHPMFRVQRTEYREQSTLRQSVEKMIRQVEKALHGNTYNIIILDEIINVVDQNFYNKDKFLKLLKSVPANKELILTGRGDISEIEDCADYVTIMIDKKHPFRRKIGARRGIEY